MSVIPKDREIPYRYIAVRALLGVGPYVQKHVVGRLPKAILNVRDLPRLSGCFTRRPTKYGRKPTYFHQPTQVYDHNIRESLKKIGFYPATPPRPGLES